MSDDSEPIDTDTMPILERPETVESPEAGVSTLFSDDVPALASKVIAYEALFRLMTSDLKFQDFMREILLMLMKTVKSEAGSILEINHKDRTIFFRAAVGHSSDRVVRFVIPMGKGIVGHVAESRQPLVVSNAAENERHLTAIADAVGFQVRNLVALPIVVRGQVFAVVELLNRIGEGNYSDSDVELLSSLCDVIARAVEVRLMIAWGVNPESKDMREKKDVA